MGIEKNRDGLEPGQAVDFETIQRIERSRQAQQPQPVKSKRDEKRRSSSVYAAIPAATEKKPDATR